MHTSEENLFRRVLALVGSEVEVGVASTGKHFLGRIVNPMFDSFLLECGRTRQVIRFNDILYLREM